MNKLLINKNCINCVEQRYCRMEDIENCTSNNYENWVADYKTMKLIVKELYNQLDITNEMLYGTKCNSVDNYDRNKQLNDNYQTLEFIDTLDLF